MKFNTILILALALAFISCDKKDQNAFESQENSQTAQVDYNSPTKRTAPPDIKRQFEYDDVIRKFPKVGETDSAKVDGNRVVFTHPIDPLFIAEIHLGNGKVIGYSFDAADSTSGLFPVSGNILPGSDFKQCKEQARAICENIFNK